MALFGRIHDFSRMHNPAQYCTIAHNARAMRCLPDWAATRTQPAARHSAAKHDVILLNFHVCRLE